MRSWIRPEARESLRAQARKLSPEGRKVARALLRRTLDELASKEREPLIRYPNSTPPTVLSSGSVTVPYRVFRVIRNPAASSLTRDRRLTRAALKLVKSEHEAVNGVRSTFPTTDSAEM